MAPLLPPTRTKVRRSAPPCTRAKRTSCRAPPSRRRSAVACPPPSPTSTPARSSSTSDLGAGADVLIAARRVSPGGRAIGLDMTTEMLELARKNAAQAGVGNVEFIEGYLEDIPLPDASVDVVLSNCVINLAADKAVVLREAARVLRPSGRFAVSDIIAFPGMNEAMRADAAKWTGCLVGALTEAEYRAALAGAGFADIEVIETNRFDQHAASAIIRARKPE